MSVSGKFKGDRKLFRQRVVRGLEVLREQKEVDPAKTMAVGYCFGGTGAIELARAGADVQAVVKPALRHRLAANYAAQASGMNSEKLIDMLLQAVPSDKKYEKPAA